MRWSRRAFVRGCALAGAGALAGCLQAPETPPREARRVEYVGAALTGGPAMQGQPLYPLRADGEGRLWVPPEAPGFGPVLDWYRFCGHEDSAGLQGGYRGDDLLRYHTFPERPGGPEDWWLGMAGQVPRVADFREVGHGAPVRWRSEGRQGKDVLFGTVIRLDASRLEVVGLDAGRVREAFFVDAGEESVLAAYNTFCKHFCCIMGWREHELARRLEHWDALFCTCHFVANDPLRIVPDFYMLDVDPPQPRALTAAQAGAAR